jgi:hypothetical protein
MLREHFGTLPSVKMKFIFAFAIIVIALSVVYGATDPWNYYKVFTVGPLTLF